MNQQQLASSLGLAGFVMVVIAQPVRADVVKVTAIELNPTAQGIEIVLTTTDNKQGQVFTSSGKTFVANIINTQLQLPDSKTFRGENPTEGIAAVTVNSVGANSIRISARSLVLSLTAPATTTATQPKPQLEAPTTETQPEEDEETAQTPGPDAATEAQGEEPPEIVVTATRTEEKLEDIPRSVTVITREQIEEQTRNTRNLTDILARTLPGFSPPTM